MTAVILWIVRLLIVLFLIRMVLRAFGVWQGPAVRHRQRVREVERAGGTLVQDPQCGTYLPKSRALAIGAGGDAKYFCSQACRDAYAAAHSR
jgi:uncharacterized protein